MVDFKYLNSPEGRREMEERIARRKEEERAFEDRRKKTVCFTGHRPDKLGGCYDLNSDQAKYIHKKLEPVLIDLIEDEGIENFYSGGAIGWDQIAFWTVQGLKNKYYNHINNIVSVPFKNQACKWNSDTQKWYQKMIYTANEVIYVDELSEYKVDGVQIGEYHVAKMQKRNEHMVDQSRIIVSAWDGSKGGTGNCIKYARKQQITWFNLRPKYNFELEELYGIRDRRHNFEI